ncbi:MAG: hypothetical protein RLZ10_1291 [Bacteroidota bacterium]|jgi:N-acetylglucosaminyldiphosphoundecaprenol N-acetyl-beta-D-mannosaminyltransferase
MLEVLNYSISSQLPAIPENGKIVVNTINPHSYCLAENDQVFKQALRSSDYLLPDGIGIVWAAKFLNGVRINKIAGYDLFLHLMNELERTKGSCFFLGASEKTLSLIKKRATKDFPGVKVETHSPPYKSVFSLEDNNAIVDKIQMFNPDVLFVGMTAPKQEKWVHDNKNEITANLICSIGAVFDFYAGTVKRPSKFWINLKLEWFVRFIKEPKRLWRRNFISTPVFVCRVIITKFSKLF